MKSTLALFIAAVVTTGAFLSDAQSNVAADPKATVATAATLQRLEREFMQAAAQRGSQGYLSYYAEDAVEVPDGEGLVRGRAEIAKQIGYLDNKQNHMSWTPVGADMSAAGDLGYTFGTYAFKGVDKAGRPLVSIGKYTTIWKLQKDGSWKVVLDMGNTSPLPGSLAPSRHLPLI